jgi:ATP-dependent Clp endopeptidase proteolytic subunit ClpP
MDPSRLKFARPVAKLKQGRTDWYRIENKANTAADVYIYDEIGYFGTSANDFVRDFAALDADEINIHLNSPGGDVFDGIAIYNAIKQHKASTTVYVDGLAASAASFIAMAGDKVIMARNAEMMIHDAWGMAIGNATDMRSMADTLDRLSNNIADIYNQRSPKGLDHWRGQMLAETWYSGTEAVAAGLADEVQGVDDSQADTENSWDLSIFKNYAGFKNRVVETPEISVPEFNTDAFQDALKELF